MKFSEAVIKGYSDPRIQGRQCVKSLYRSKDGRHSDRPVGGGSACVVGAAILGSRSDYGCDTMGLWERTGVDAVEMNNEGMDWRDIVGIAIAEGL